MNPQDKEKGYVVQYTYDSDPEEAATHAPASTPPAPGTDPYAGYGSNPYAPSYDHAIPQEEMPDEDWAALDVNYHLLFNILN